MCVWFMCVLYDTCRHVCVCLQVQSFVSPSLHIYLIVFETTTSANVELINSAINTGWQQVPGIHLSLPFTPEIIHAQLCPAL